MTTKVKIAIGVGVLLAVGGIAYARSRKRTLTCGPGQTFKRYAKPSDVPNYAIYSETTRRAIDAHIREYGGTCMATVTAELDDSTPDHTGDAGGDATGLFGLGELVHGIGSWFSGEPDKDDDEFITQPSQLG